MYFSFSLPILVDAAELFHGLYDGVFQKEPCLYDLPVY